MIGSLAFDSVGSKKTFSHQILKRHLHNCAVYIRYEMIFQIQFAYVQSLRSGMIENHFEFGKRVKYENKNI